MHRGFDLGWFCTGIATIALALGYLVGASNSPVAGTAITAIFGLGVALVGLVKERVLKESGDNKTNLLGSMRVTGILLTTFSIVYLATIIGSSMLREKLSKPQSVAVPWNEKNAPNDPAKALEWLVIERRLIAYGYSVRQIQSLYELNNKNKPAPEPFFSKDLLECVPEPGESLKRPLAGGAVAKGTDSLERVPPA